MFSAYYTDFECDPQHGSYEETMLSQDRETISQCEPQKSPNGSIRIDFVNG